MKVPQSIRRIYEIQLEPSKRLKGRVDERIRSIKRERWHYESRLKELPSFTLKVESGRCKQPAAVEDFFACTLVVGNNGEIGEAERLIRESFEVVERRPQRENVTFNKPADFSFDDLRLYMRWKDDPSLPPSGMTNLVFEIQVRTFLQHAWSIATHDLVYKTDEASWSKARIAFQIRAMLEHAEVSIQEAERLSQSQAIAKTDRSTKTLVKFIDLVKSLWNTTDLPSDLRRLAENIRAVSEALKIDDVKLKEILVHEGTQGRGPLTLNLSPYGVVVQSLIMQRGDKFSSLLQDSTSRVKILIPAEIHLPGDLQREACVNAIFVD